MFIAQWYTSLQPSGPPSRHKHLFVDHITHCPSYQYSVRFEGSYFIPHALLQVTNALRRGYVYLRFYIAP